MNSTLQCFLRISLRSISFLPTGLRFSSHFPSKNRISASKLGKFNSAFIRPGLGYSSTTSVSSLSSMQVKKRAIRKKKLLEEETTPGVYNVVAYATAEEYNLEKLVEGLRKQGLFEAKSIPNDRDVVYATAKYIVGKEPRELFIFREGSIILWNITDLEMSNVLAFLRPFEQGSYKQSIVQSESEVMSYKYHLDEQTPSCIDKEGNFVLNPNQENLPLTKYTFSNGMALSVKLGIWESSLDTYIEQIEGVTNDLKLGKRINMTRDGVLRKHGELFALRHYLNLSSDVLDTPDFYWDNERLERLYNQVCLYFSIAKRSRVMNEKINHCVALIELLSSHLSDKHHVRLEWMIIILICIEVMFETIHYIDRYVRE